MESVNLNDEYGTSLSYYLMNTTYLLNSSTFTSSGPSACVNNILDNSNLLWVEDRQWDEERINSLSNHLKSVAIGVTDHWRKQYESKADKYWNEFYKRNEDHFFKDRHYLHVIFPELLCKRSIDFTNEGFISEDILSVETKFRDSLTHTDDNEQGPTLLEVGCGVGNAILPLLLLNENLQVICVDFAKSAIEILKRHSLYLSAFPRIQAYECDVASNVLPTHANSVDLILCMFVLSAITPCNHLSVFQKFANALKVGGRLMIRDYGRLDEAEVRFIKHSKIADHYYVRQDGTCSYFFDLDEVNQLAKTVGLCPLELYYVRRQYANRAQQKARYRVWVHGKFVKMKDS